MESAPPLTAKRKLRLELGGNIFINSSENVFNESIRENRLKILKFS